MVTMRQGASLPWSGVRSASVTMSLSCAASGPGATMSRALPERRVERWARSDELSLNMVRHVGFSAPLRKCCEPFATDFGPCQAGSGAIRFFPYAIFALGCPIRPAGVRAHNRSEEHTSEHTPLMRISYDVFC